jgi:DNA polymerase-3 subunit gamma/tau
MISLRRDRRFRIKEKLFQHNLLFSPIPKIIADSQPLRLNYGNRIGPLATIRCKPRQVRKEATVAADSCAGMWLVRLPPYSLSFLTEPEMSYQVLARKWRPHNFSEIVGQEHVVKSLINALQHDRLHHAYLFTGTRGVGKTTLARILAKAINCENLQDTNPCGACKVCRDVDEGRFLDLIEVDAASRTKVEDTRDLLDNAQYAPSQGRFKVYLIDEVHMLSGHSFNALLKTLEEPPAHVKFLLATTDPHKIPVTVLSRCLQFNLKRLSQEQIFGQMEFILNQESIAFEASALRLLARAADGSMRDGLSLLDQAIVHGNGKVAAGEVGAMLGVIAQQPVGDLLHALAAQDAPGLLKVIADLADLSPDFSGVLRQLLQALHAVAVLQQAPVLIDAGLDSDLIKTLAGKLPPEDVHLYYQIGLLGQKDLDLAPDPRSGFEMALLRMLAFRPAFSNTAREARPQPVVKPSHTPAPARPAPNLAVSPPREEPAAPPEIQPLPAADSWPEMIAAMRLESITKQLAQQCALQSIDDHTCTLLLDPAFQTMLSPMRTEKLQAALRTLRGKPVKLTILIEKPTIATPAEQLTKQREDRQQAAVDAIEADQNIQALKEHFGARVIPGTIEPV